jgi:hypothetical protein
VKSASIDELLSSWLDGDDDDDDGDVLECGETGAANNSLGNDDDIEGVGAFGDDGVRGIDNVTNDNGFCCCWWCWWCCSWFDDNVDIDVDGIGIDCEVELDDVVVMVGIDDDDGDDAGGSSSTSMVSEKGLTLLMEE